MEYSSLVNWTERFTRSWPGDAPTGAAPTSNRAPGPRLQIPGPSQTTPSAKFQRPPSRLYPFSPFCTCHPDPLDPFSPRTLRENSEVTASSLEASPSPPPIVHFPGRPEVYRTYTTRVPLPEECLLVRSKQMLQLLAFANVFESLEIHRHRFRFMLRFIVLFN